MQSGLGELAFHIEDVVNSQQQHRRAGDDQSEEGMDVDMPMQNRTRQNAHSSDPMEGAHTPVGSSPAEDDNNTNEEQAGSFPNQHVNQMRASVNLDEVPPTRRQQAEHSKRFRQSIDTDCMDVDSSGSAFLRVLEPLNNLPEISDMLKQLFSGQDVEALNYQYQNMQSLNCSNCQRVVDYAHRQQSTTHKLLQSLQKMLVNQRETIENLNRQVTMYSNAAKFAQQSKTEHNSMDIQVKPRSASVRTHGRTANLSMLGSPGDNDMVSAQEQQLSMLNLQPSSSSTSMKQDKANPHMSKIALKIITQPPAQAIYQRILRPFPAVAVMGAKAKHCTNLFVEVSLLKKSTTGASSEYQSVTWFKNGGCPLDGDKAKNLIGGQLVQRSLPGSSPDHLVVIFRKLKILTTTAQQQGSFFVLKFSLKRYNDNLFEPVTEVEPVISDPIEIFSHTLYLKGNKDNSQSTTTSPYNNAAMAPKGRVSRSLDSYSNQLFKHKTGMGMEIDRQQESAALALANAAEAMHQASDKPREPTFYKKSSSRAIPARKRSETSDYSSSQSGSFNQFSDLVEHALSAVKMEQ